MPMLSDDGELKWKAHPHLEWTITGKFEEVCGTPPEMSSLFIGLHLLLGKANQNPSFKDRPKKERTQFVLPENSVQAAGSSSHCRGSGSLDETE